MAKQSHREKAGTCKSEIKEQGVSGSELKRHEVVLRLPAFLFCAPTSKCTCHVLLKRFVYQHSFSNKLSTEHLPLEGSRGGLCIV